MTQPDPMLALEAAVFAGDADRVRDVITANPSLRGRLNEALPNGSFGSTALLTASSNGQREIAEILLDAGADIDQRSHWWAGSFGVLDNDEGLAEFFIERGATVDAYAAARHGMLDALAQLIAADQNVVNMRGGDGQTPLHVAKTLDVARMLLDNGADIDALDVDHESTPAQYLVREHTDVARYLVARGCRVDIMLAAALGDVAHARGILDRDPAAIRTAVNARWFPMRDPRAGGHIYIWTLGANKSAHRVAKEFGHRDVVDVLLERSPVVVRLSFALETGDLQSARKTLREHPDVGAQLTDDDHQRLVAAAECGDAAAVMMMLDVGWPVHASINGATALHYASWHGSLEIVRALLSRGARVDMIETTYNGTPLGWALHGSLYSDSRDTGDYAGVVEALVKAGAARAPTDMPHGSKAVMAELERRGVRL